MWLNIALYGLWLLSGNVTNDQTVNALDQSAFRRDFTPLPPSTRAFVGVNQSFSMASRLVATVDADSPRDRSTDAVLVRPHREPVDVILIPELEHLAFWGNDASWHSDNSSTCSSRSLVNPLSRLPSPVHLIRAKPLPWPPDGWPKTSILHELLIHLWRIVDLLVNEILCGDWAPRLAHTARYRVGPGLRPAQALRVCGAPSRS